MDKIDTAIVIVNFNGKPFLNDCLVSVFSQTYKAFRLIFVDNASVDGSIDFVRQNFPNVDIVALEKNYGYGKAANLGIQKALLDPAIEYVVCLNNDTIADKNWIQSLIKTARTDFSIGSVSSKAYFPDGRIQNAGLSLEKALQVNLPGGISIGFGCDDNIKNLKTDIEIFAAGGVAALYSRKMLETVGLFDEDFFAYSEDLDLGFRARLAGFKAVLAAEAKLIHLHSQTAGAASEFKAYLLERNTVLTAVKNFPIHRLFAFAFENLLLKLSYLYKKNPSVEKLGAKISFPKMFWILVKAHLAAAVMLPKTIRKRCKIQKHKKTNNRQIEKWFSDFGRYNIEKGI